MAKRKINKSQMVRDVLESGVTGTSEVVATLARKKVKVSPQMVSNLKGKMGGTKKRRGRKAKRSEAGSALDVTALLQAKFLVTRVGSVTEAKKAIDIWGKLSE